MDNKLLYMLSLAGQLGFIIALPAVIFLFGGAYLDKRLETAPIFILVGALVASAISAFLIYRMIKKVEK